MTLTIFLRDILGLFALCIPIALSYLAQLLLTVFSTHAVKALGVPEQAGVTLGIMFCNCTGFAVVFGLASAADTLFSQAYGADRYSPLLSVYMQRSLLMCYLFCIPVGVIWVLSAFILRVMGQSENVVLYASLLIHWYVIVLIPAVSLELVRKLAQVFNIVAPFSVLAVTSVLLGSFFYKPAVAAIGIPGAVLSMSLITCVNLAACCFIFFWYGLPSKLWHGFSRAALHDLDEFLRFGIPCMLMMFIEWGSFEALGFLAGLLGVVELDSIAITMQIAALIFMIHLGLGSAVSVKVGTYLGSGDPIGARRCAFLGITLSITFVATSILAVLVVGPSAVRFYTDDPEVFEKTVALLPLLATFHCCDGLLAYAAGVVRGLGHQMFGFYVILLLYAIGLPVSALLSFTFGMRERGIWCGPILGGIISVAVYVVYLVRVDWNKAAEEASARLERGMETMRAVDKASAKESDVIEDEGVDDDVVLHVSEAHEPVPHGDAAATAMNNVYDDADERKVS